MNLNNSIDWIVYIGVLLISWVPNHCHGLAVSICLRAALNSVWPSDATWRQRSRSPLPDGTRPLPEPMLTHQLHVGPVTLVWEQFHKMYLSHPLLA